MAACWGGRGGSYSSQLGFRQFSAALNGLPACAAGQAVLTARTCAQGYEEAGTDLAQALTQKEAMARAKAAMKPDVARALARLSSGLYVVTAAHTNARGAMARPCPCIPQLHLPAPGRSACVVARLCIHLGRRMAVLVRVRCIGDRVCSRSRMAVEAFSTTFCMCSAARQSLRSGSRVAA